MTLKGMDLFIHYGNNFQMLMFFVFFFSADSLVCIMVVKNEPNSDTQIVSAMCFTQ